MNGPDAELALHRIGVDHILVDAQDIDVLVTKGRDIGKLKARCDPPSLQLLIHAVDT